MHYDAVPLCVELYLLKETTRERFFPVDAGPHAKPRRLSHNSVKELNGVPVLLLARLLCCKNLLRLGKTGLVL